MGPLSVPIVDPYPGVLGVVHGFQKAWLRLGPVTGWPSWQPIDEWKRQYHLIDKRELSPALRERVSVSLPEEQLSDERPMVRRMCAATPLMLVRPNQRARLLELGLRVYTVGYHRVPDLLRVVAAGGGRPAVWIEQGSLGFPDHIDRMLRVATGGVVDERLVLHAVMLDINHWSGSIELDGPRAREPDPRESLIGLEDEDWAQDLIRDYDHPFDRPTEHVEDDLRRSYPLEAPAQTLRVAAALAAGELERVRVVVDPQGDKPNAPIFRRERVPEQLLPRYTPERHDGWLPPFELIWPDGPPDMAEGYLRAPAEVRYVRA